MSVEIVWNEGTMGEWAARFASCRRSTLPQVVGYARASAKTEGWLPRLGLIRDDGREVGLVQVLERRLARLVHVRRVHRGPLWFEGGETSSSGALLALRREFPARFLERFDFLPELPNEPASRRMLEEAGFRRVGIGYQTIWLDLTRDLDATRAALSASWRQRLRRAERAGLTINVDWNAMSLPWLMAREAENAALRGYRALPGKFAVRLRNALVRDDGALIVAASLDGKPVASGLFLCHGRSVTYQVGWSGETGRETQAMRLVLWRAIEACRERGFTDLDLGGVNPDSASGVTEFKMGMGGEMVESVGRYR